ncbi:MAG: hypothetical protein Q7R94_00160 [bacterium]|nr:hypothetical protein [bacterium]
MGKVSVSVVSGDIGKVSADALITAINSIGLWCGGIDYVIDHVAGNLFHSQARAAMPLRDGQTVVARGNGGPNAGAFSNVVFVVDDLKCPLHYIVREGLKAASAAGFNSVSLPAIRMGVMLGLVEESVDEAVREMAKGVKQFIAANPGTSLTSITFVVRGDPKTQSLLQKAIQ